MNNEIVGVATEHSAPSPQNYANTIDVGAEVWFIAPDGEVAKGVVREVREDDTHDAITVAGVRSNYPMIKHNINAAFATKLDAINWLIVKANQHLIDYANGDVD